MRRLATITAAVTKTVTFDREAGMAKTALEIDRALMHEAMAAMSTRTVTDTVHQALRRVVDLHRLMALLDRLGEAAEHDLDEARRDREQSSFNQVQDDGFAGGSPTPG